MLNGRSFVSARCQSARRARILSMLGVSIALSLPAWPQAEERPRIVLALGGGGAKGAAHIGVLRELEALHVPVDAIVGTSMGAIVGGLYAAGLSLDEIERTLVGLDWQEALSDKTARELLSFRRKQDDARLKIKASIGWKAGRLSLPRGVLQGQKLQLILREILLPVANVDDFDRLAIPFRAVAADLEHGEAVVLGSGDLVQSIRASMSLPGVFEPVPIGERLLIDGGIVANVPVDAARGLGADVIIAVDVGTQPVMRDQIANPLAVTNQVLTLLMTRETERQLATLGPRDILLRPDLSGVSAGSFLEAATAIPRGAAAAQAARDRLAALGIEAAAYAGLRQGQRMATFAVPEVAGIRVVEDARLAAQYITSRMRTEVGEPIDLDTLSTDLQRIYGLGIFESVGFRLLPTDPPTEPLSSVLEIEARQKDWGTSFVRLGLDLATDLDGATTFDLGVRFTLMPLNRLGGEWRNDVSIGELVLLSTELYQPINVGGFFVAPAIRYREDNLPLVADDGVVELRLEGPAASFDIGKEFGTWGELRLGLDRQSLEADVIFGPQGSAELDLAFAGLRFEADTLDDSAFPTRGLFGRVAYREGLAALGGEIRDRFLEGQLDIARTFGRHSLNLGLIAASSLEDEPQLAPYLLGGFLRLSGLRRNELVGTALFLSRLVYYRRLGSESLLGQPLYAGFSLEGGNTWHDPSQFSLDDLQAGGSVFIGADTILGPVYAGVGVGERGAREYYLLFGQAFDRRLSPLFR